MHYVYILYSKALDKYYVGETSDIEKRMIEHRNKVYQRSYTARASDWTLKTALPFDTISSAKKAEHFIKRMNSRIFIEKLLENHQWLLEKFK